MANSESVEYLNQARYFVGVEQYNDALEYINKAIATDKLNKELYVQKSIILANLDQYTEAIGELKNALKIDRAYAEAYFHLGNLYLMTGEQALGLESYNKAIANGFDDSQIFFNLGLMYEEDGNDELAIRNYTKAILKDPLRVDARVRKAKIFIANGKQQEALETLDELILADPDLYDGYHLKALLLADMGNLDGAMSILDEAMRLFPKDPSFQIDKVNILVMREEADRARDLVKVIENTYEMELDQKRHLELEKARLYALDADIDSIVDSLIRAKTYSKEADPNDIDPEATFLLTNCYLEKKDYPAAIACAKELISSDELAYAIPSYYTLPYAYAQAGEEDKAKVQYKESISKLRSITLDNPELLDGYLFRALCLKEVGQFEKALELSEYLIKVDPNSSTFHSLKAEILYAMGNDDTAKAEKATAESLKQ